MKLLLVLVVAMAAYVVADDDKQDKHECGILEMVKVRRQWAECFGEGEHRLQFGLHLFQRLFKAHPEARAQFSNFRGDNIYSPVFQAHGQRILQALGLLIETTDEQDILKELLGSVKEYLTSKGIKPEFYGHFRDALLETLPDYLENHLDWDAWFPCVNTLIDKLAH